MPSCVLLVTSELYSGGKQAGKDNPQGMDVAGDIGVDDLNQVSQVSVQN